MISLTDQVIPEKIQKSYFSGISTGCVSPADATQNDHK